MKHNQTSVAEAGTLDPTFGEQAGKSTFTIPGFGYGTVLGITEAPDKKIYITGYAVNDDTQAFWIASLSADGRLLKDFGRDGYYVGNFEQDEKVPYGYQINIIQDDPQNTKLLLTGLSDGNIALARFTTTGELDTTFGVQGKIVHRIEPVLPARNTSENPAIRKTTTSPQKNLTDKNSTTAIVTLNPTTTHVLPDKKIVVAAHYRNNEMSSSGLVCRFLENGMLDTSLNNLGYFVIDHPQYNIAHVYINNMMIAKDGTYIFCGAVRSGEDPASALFASYHENGSVNEYFGSSGFKTIPDSRDVHLSLVLDRLAPTPEGGVIGVGSSSKNIGFPPSDALIIAINKNGSINGDFNEGRPLHSTVNGVGAVWRTGTVQPDDGKIIAVGRAVGLEDPYIYKIAATRLLSNGKPDPDFNKGEILRLSLSSEADTALPMVQQESRRIVLGGQSDGEAFVAGLRG